MSLTAETAKSIPAWIGTIASIVTLNQVLALCTICYVLLQAAYLIWKWRREANDDD